MLPLNDSLSISINALVARTTISIGPTIERNSIEINGKNIDEDDEEGFGRFRRVLDELHKIVERRDGVINSSRKRAHSGNEVLAAILPCTNRIKVTQLTP